MEALKLLLVEDNEQDITSCRNSVEVYEQQKERNIIIVESRELKDALEKLDSSFDGAIVDLKLDRMEYDGNELVSTIYTKFRIPVVIFTGTPLNAIDGIPGLRVYTKGKDGYNTILDYFFDVYETGLTKILGGRGYIEETMHKIFWENIYPALGDWLSHVGRGKPTEKALLRFTINHLLELIDDDLETSFPEEMYISPPLNKGIKTGSIVEKVEPKECFVVLSPACDLVIRQGNIKTDNILVCKIDRSIITKAQKTLKRNNIDDAKRHSAEELLTNLVTNKHSNYYHFLPKTSHFSGGVINFRKVSTIKPAEFSSQFSKPIVQVSQAFTKDIVARFSSYYARQGQPDFDFAALIEQLKND